MKKKILTADKAEEARVFEQLMAERNNHLPKLLTVSYS